MSTLTELGTFLSTSMSLTEGTELFLGSRPDDPDTVLVLYEYPGGAPEYVQNQMPPIVEKVQIQVLARAKRYEEASVLAHRAWIALAPITNAVLSGTKYRSIRPNASPAILGRDTNDRLMVYFNASVEKEVSLVA